jgi:hypothetical protein
VSAQGGRLFATDCLAFGCPIVSTHRFVARYRPFCKTA